MANKKTMPETEIKAVEEKSTTVAEKPKSKRSRTSKKTVVETVSAVQETPVVAEEVVEVEVTPVTEETPAPVAEEKAAADEKKSTAKKTTAKKSTAKKTATKTTAKTTAKKTTTKKKADAPAVEEKKPVEKKTTAKKTASVNVFFQYQGTESAELIEKAKELSGVKSPKSVNLYIKPEENMVYYVVDDIAGGFEL